MREDEVKADEAGPSTGPVDLGLLLNALCTSVRTVLVNVEGGRAKSIAITKLDEFELWIAQALYRGE